MQIGIKGEKKVTVTKDQLACNVGSGLVSVFATPMMIAAIENTACLLYTSQACSRRKSWLPIL